MSDKAGGSKIGEGIGAVGGGIAGGYYGGPVGAFIGSTAGGYLGTLIGGGIGSLFGSDGPSSAQVLQQKQQAQAYADEQAQQARLTQIANGQGPSVAGQQVAGTLSQIERGAQSMAAGARGDDGVLARYAAIQAGAQAAADANQTAAMARVKEISDANTTLAGLDSSTLGTTSGNTNSANQLALNSQIAQNDYNTKLLGSGLQGAGQYLAFNGTNKTAGGSSGSSSLGSGLNFTAPTDPDGVATLAS